MKTPRHFSVGVVLLKGAFLPTKDSHWIDVAKFDACFLQCRLHQTQKPGVCRRGNRERRIALYFSSLQHSSKEADAEKNVTSCGHSSFSSFVLSVFQGQRAKVNTSVMFCLAHTLIRPPCACDSLCKQQRFHASRWGYENLLCFCRGRKTPTGNHWPYFGWKLGWLYWKNKEWGSKLRPRQFIMRRASKTNENWC